VEIGVGVSHRELEAILEVSELLAVLTVLDNDLDCGWGGCNDTRVGAGDNLELREGMKKRFVGVVVLMLLVLVVLARGLFILTRLPVLDNRRCSLGERGITTVEADSPNLEKRGVSS
jgi:hypothetical protein